ncbi:hypothetical protein [Thalassotalea sp. G2M2-11]|uniref:tetratricopeptide repeat protein n=1 Tax=Thalassotalea sp. G2M2-11 TaxID=2787627 RepID=UPI0019D1C951|nr:hypothetical protein [Thalassotalea sp. G2M2-11]
MRCLLIGCYGLFLLCFSGLATAQEQPDKSLALSIAQIERLFLVDPESLSSSVIVDLSRVIIKNRQLVSNNTLAKMFSLLSDSAANKGDLDKALQFALDGEELFNLDKSLKLSLLLKIAKGKYFKGKYQQTKRMADRAVKLAEQIDEPILLITAMGYRAMANAVIAEHQLAWVDLQQIQQLLDEYQEFNDHINLLTVIANAHYYSGAYQTALQLFNKVKKIRFDLKKNNNIDLTFYDIARCYLKLGQLDDAFYAFDAAKRFAKQKQAPIRVAYAKLGLAQVLIKQRKYQQALDDLLAAKQLFQGQNLSQPYLTTLINLAKVTQLIAKQSESLQYIQQAAEVVKHTELTEEQIVFYQMLASMYQQQGDYQAAFAAQAQYITMFQKYNHPHQHSNDDGDVNQLANQKNSELALRLAAEAELKNQFQEKYNQQSNLILNLVIALILVLSSLVILALKLRAVRLNQQYDEIEKPTDILATPTQTKSFYQHYFKMARKFEYQLSVGYFSIDNWQELTFQFNNKVIDEVNRTIATLINEHKGEFDQVGLINQGEYLFLAPYQSPEKLKATFEQLTQALKVQFFANLGEFSLKVSYDCQSPNVQDIDPYFFLSRLSESTRAEYSGYKT